MANPIGVGRCPIGCGSEKARYTVSSKQLAVATCNACHTQVFARSDRSDEILRRNIITRAGEPVDQVEASAAAPAIAAPAPTPAAPVTAPATPKPVRKLSWGMLAGREV